MDAALEALIRLQHAAGNAGWLREALAPPGAASSLSTTAADADAAPACECWSPERLLASPVNDWLQIGAPIGAREAAFDAEADAAVERTRDWLRRDAAHAVLGWHDAEYPSLLRDIANPPTVLYVNGAVERLWWPQVAVVGSRAPTSAGRERAARWSRAFAEAGFVVTSGLAAGIDAAAHSAALDAAENARVAASVPGTVAVTGTGPDRCFPAAHRDLQAAIARSGCVVTEHAPGAEARPEHFPSRNRIIAGLSLGTIVIEAAQRSGALITARLAAEAGREVFAIPGAPENLKARGCHRLIRDGAMLVEMPEEVSHELTVGAANAAGRLRRALGLRASGGASSAAATAASRSTRADDGFTTAPDPAQDAVLQALQGEGAGFDALLLRTGLTSASLAPILLAMELEGRLTQQHGVYLPSG